MFKNSSFILLSELFSYSFLIFISDSWSFSYSSIGTLYKVKELALEL